MAAIPNKYLYTNAKKYFNKEMSKKEEKIFENTLKINLKVVKEVF